MSIFNNNTGFFQQGKSFGGLGLAEGLSKVFKGLSPKQYAGILQDMNEPDNSEFNANPEGGQGYMEMIKSGQIPGAQPMAQQLPPVLPSPYKRAGLGGLK